MKADMTGGDGTLLASVTKLDMSLGAEFQEDWPRLGPECNIYISKQFSRLKSEPLFYN
jgi:hypothetical protein